MLGNHFVPNVLSQNNDPFVTRVVLEEGGHSLEPPYRPQLVDEIGTR